MTTKQITRYTCEWCGKKGYSASHMTKHERHCTKNPHRICRVCGMLEQKQAPITELLQTLPDPKDYTHYGELIVECPVTGESLTKAVEICLPELRARAGNCPACIMAALRQRGIPVPMMANQFSFTNEMEAIWSDINDKNIY